MIGGWLTERRVGRRWIDRWWVDVSNDRIRKKQEHILMVSIQFLPWDVQTFWHPFFLVPLSLVSSEVGNVKNGQVLRMTTPRNMIMFPKHVRLKFCWHVAWGLKFGVILWWFWWSLIWMVIGIFSNVLTIGSECATTTHLSAFLFTMQEHSSEK